MQGAIVLCFLALTAVGLARPNDGEKYTDRYDYINISEVLGNDKLLTAYGACLLDKGKCTAEAKELKSHMTDAMQNDCKKCTDSQRAGTKQVITYLINFKPDTWNELKEKYDASGKFSAKYEKQLKEMKH